MQFAKGIGNDGGAAGANPLITIRISRDGGATFGPALEMQAGAIGQYGLMTYLNRLGYARNFVIWVRCTDPCLWQVINAELDVFECAA